MMLFNNSSAIEFPQFSHFRIVHCNGFLSKMQIRFFSSAAGWIKVAKY
jgi:hypothetical protein